MLKRTFVPARVRVQFLKVATSAGSFCLLFSAKTIAPFAFVVMVQFVAVTLDGFAA